MRTNQLLAQYLQSVLFIGLGVRCVQGWFKSRETRSAHLAWATGLFGLSSLISAVNVTLHDAAKAEIAPTWVGIVSGIAIYLSVYAFLLFLSNFVAFHLALHALALLVTLTAIVFAFIERPELRFDPQKGLVRIPGINNPVDYLSYISGVLAYLGIAFGILWVAFLIYGMRLRGLGRFRMLSIAAGFFLLFIAIGLLPRVLFGKPTTSTVNAFLTAVRYVALASAPMLFVGFTPPRWVTRRFTREPAPDPPFHT